MSEPSKCRLVTATPFPPGGFPYSQTVNGKTYKFPDIGLDLTEQGRLVAKFRRANGFDRATNDESIDDVNVFTCQRLGCDPRFCSDGTAPAQPFYQQKSGGCSTCGAKL